MQIHTKPLWLNCRWQTTSVDSDLLFLGSSPVKDRQYNNNDIFFFEQIEMTFSGVKFTLFFFFFLFCFVFLYLIPGRRQLPKLRKFPGVASRCRLHPSPPSKKYVCKQTFDCCRECNHAFYICISMAGQYTYRACTHGAYKRVCDCIVLGTTLQASNTTPY